MGEDHKANQQRAGCRPWLDDSAPHPSLPQSEEKSANGLRTRWLWSRDLNQKTEGIPHSRSRLSNVWILGRLRGENAARTQTRWLFK